MLVRLQHIAVSFTVAVTFTLTVRCADIWVIGFITTLPVIIAIGNVQYRGVFIWFPVTMMWFAGFPFSW